MRKLFLFFCAIAGIALIAKANDFSVLPFIAAGFVPGVISTNESRALYEWLQKNYPAPGKIVTEGYLCFITALDTTKLVTFNVLEDGTTAPLAGENRLKRSDAFWSMSHRFCIAKIPSGGNVRNIVPEFYPNGFIFTDATELLALKSLYWTGKLNIKIGSTVYYDNFGIHRFENSKVNESGLAASANATVNVYNRSNVDDMVAVRELVPHIFYNGTFSNEVSIKLAESVAMGGTASTTNYAIYMNYGFYINNGALSQRQLNALMSGAGTAERNDVKNPQARLKKRSSFR